MHPSPPRPSHSDTHLRVSTVDTLFQFPFLVALFYAVSDDTMAEALLESLSINYPCSKNETQVLPLCYCDNV